MNALQTNRAKYLALVFGVIVALAALRGVARTNEAPPFPTQLGVEDTEFIFAGKCPHGENYRLHQYQKSVQGESLWFYDYQGPAGVGSVGTPTTPQVMSSRICRASAEILGVY
jgi:hypothetical protein